MSFIKEFWLPDAEILNLKEFKTLDVLSKLEVNIITRLTFHYGQTSSFKFGLHVKQQQPKVYDKKLLKVKKQTFLGIMAEQKLWDNVCSGHEDNLHLSNDIQQFPPGCASLSVSGMQNLLLFWIFNAFLLVKLFFRFFFGCRI